MPAPTAKPPVSLLRMADGLIVWLCGDLNGSALPQLRRALLMPLPAGCRDVIVDAGEVTAIDDAALAALLAAKDWATAGGGRFSTLRVSRAVTEALDELALAEALPGLPPPTPPNGVRRTDEPDPAKRHTGPAAKTTEPIDMVPRPRHARD